MISYTTPLEIIEQLKTKIGEYVSANSREWSGFALNIEKMGASLLVVLRQIVELIFFLQNSKMRFGLSWPWSVSFPSCVSR